MTRFTLMMAVVAMFSTGSLLAETAKVEEGTAKFTVIEHPNGTHVHPHGFVGKNGKMHKHKPATLFSFGGTFTLFSLKNTLKKAGDAVKKGAHKAHEVGSKIAHSDLAHVVVGKGMDKVGDLIESGAAEDMIKKAAGAAMTIAAK